MNIVLIGFKKCGKTTIGKKLEIFFKREFIDTDVIIEKIFEEKFSKKLSCYEIFKKNGEEFFRKIEKEAIKTLENTDNMIIAIGGGSLLDKDNICILKKRGFFVYLETPLDILKKRVFGKNKKNIFSSRLLDFEASFLKRKKIYKEKAHLIIKTENKSVLELARDIYSKLPSSYVKFRSN
jgi:shikimate kinase